MNNSVFSPMAYYCIVQCASRKSEYPYCMTARSIIIMSIFHMDGRTTSTYSRTRVQVHAGYLLPHQLLLGLRDRFYELLVLS